MIVVPVRMYTQSPCSVGFVLRGYPEAVLIRTLKHVLGRQKDERDGRNSVLCLQKNFLCKEPSWMLRWTVFSLQGQSPNKLTRVETWGREIWGAETSEMLAALDEITISHEGYSWFLVTAVVAGQSKTMQSEVCSRSCWGGVGNQEGACGLLQFNTVVQLGCQRRVGGVRAEGGKLRPDLVTVGPVSATVHQRSCPCSFLFWIWE